MHLLINSQGNGREAKGWAGPGSEVYGTNDLYEAAAKISPEKSPNTTSSSFYLPGLGW